MKLRARHLVLVSALTACGGKSPPAAPTTSSATSAGPAKVTPPECAGAEIDLAAAMANEACQIRGEASTMKPDALDHLDMKVAPESPSVVGGATMKATATLTNKGDVPLVLAFSFGKNIAAETRDGKGAKIKEPCAAGGEMGAMMESARNSLSGTGGPTGPDGQPLLVQVALAPGGHLKATVEWQTMTIKWQVDRKGGSCSASNVGSEPLKPGDYQVAVTLPAFANIAKQPDLMAPVAVKKK